MHIRFSEIDDAFMKEVVEQGFYLSETEFVRDAVRRMRESIQSQKPNRFADAVTKGRQSLSNQETVKYTPDLINEVKETAIKKHKNKEGYNSNDAISN